MHIDVIIEVPQGSRNKYEMDSASGPYPPGPNAVQHRPATRPTTGSSPAPWPRTATRWTRWFLLGEPAFPGTYVTARPVAMFWMHDEHGPDAKILAVPAHDPRYDQLGDLPDVPVHLLAEISHFFDVYKELEPGKSADVRGWQDRDAAERVITEALRAGHGNRPGEPSGEVI